MAARTRYGSAPRELDEHTTLGARWFTSAYGRGAALLLAGLLGAGMVNVGFHVLLAGRLDESSSLTFGRLLVVLLACSAPFDALLVLVTRQTVHLSVAEPGAEIDWLPAARRAVGIGVVVAGLVVSSLSLADGRVGGATALTSLLIGVYAIAAAVGSVPRGVLLGTGRSRPVAGAALTRVSVRVMAFLALAGSRPGLGTVVAALAVGEVAASAVVVTRARVGTASARSTLELPGGVVLWASLAFGGLWMLVAVEAVVAGRYLPDWVSGRYTAGIDLARMVIFVPQALAMVAMASFARGGRVASDALRVTLRLSAITGALTAGLTVALGPSLGVVLTADAQLPRSLLLVFGVTAWTLGLLVVLVVYQVIGGLPCVATMWAAAAATVVGAWWWHSGAVALATVFVLTALGALTRLLVGPALADDAGPATRRERRQLQPRGDTLDLTVVVPFFNPGGDVLRGHLLELVRTLERERVRFEVIAVSDGSTDGSDELARELEPRGVRTLVLARHRGKGAALRAGLDEARGRYLGFIDADGDIPPDQWHHFLALIDLYHADMVVGSKRHALSEVHYPLLRHLYSRIFQALVHLLFRVDVTDTQTGIKLFRREVLVDVWPLLVEDGFLFDLEVLVAARRRGWRRVLEAPVRVEHQFRSTICVRSALRMLRQTWVLAARVHIARVYDAPAAPTLPAPAPALVERAGAAQRQPVHAVPDRLGHA